jgi:hypothetical protein
MSSRQRMLNRSGVVEPYRIACCRWRPLRTAGGTTTAMVVMLPNGEVDNDNFEPSAGDSFDIGSGAGVDSVAEHWQKTPCAHRPWQQQEPDALERPQHPRCDESSVDLPQHDGSTGALRSQCGQAGAIATGEQRTEPSVGRQEWLPQLQTVRGRAPTGTSMAASQTIIRAAMLLWTCTATSHSRDDC